MFLSSQRSPGRKAGVSCCPTPSASQYLKDLKDSSQATPVWHRHSCLCCRLYFKRNRLARAALGDRFDGFAFNFHFLAIPAIFGNLCPPPPSVSQDLKDLAKTSQATIGTGVEDLLSVFLFRPSVFLCDLCGKRVPDRRSRAITLRFRRSPDSGLPPFCIPRSKALTRTHPKGRFVERSRPRLRLLFFDHRPIPDDRIWGTSHRLLVQLVFKEQPHSAWANGLS